MMHFGYLMYNVYNSSYTMMYVFRKRFLCEKPVVDSQYASKPQQPPSMLTVLCGSLASCHILQ